MPLKGDFTIDPTDYSDAPGGVIFPNPNAPTSRYLPIEAVEDIVRHNQNKVVIIDEAYIDFAPESAVALTRKYENLLVIPTLSKSRALAGLRVGFALGNEQLIQALVRMKDSFNSYPVDRLAMAGATAAIRDKAYFEAARDKVIATREWTTAKLTQEGFRVLPSAANFVFATHPDHSAQELYEALREQDVLIRYFGKEPIDQYLRISIGTEEEMQRFLKVLRPILAAKN